MDATIGTALQDFHGALCDFEAALAAWPVLSEPLLAARADWRKHLRFKLLPNLNGESCLIVAVAGGTNTGKSTVFNMLLGADVSPVRTTAAATCRPLLAANPARADQAIAGTLLPGLAPRPLSAAEDVLAAGAPEDAVFVSVQPGLPDQFVLLDIPDVDSIELSNWEVAGNIQAAGDVIIAVLTGEKYKDEKVVDFFRRAAASGRVVYPLMNKANAYGDFAVARAQLAEFCSDTHLMRPPLFVVPHDFSLAEDYTRPIQGLDDAGTLRDRLEALDPAPIKRAVLDQTLIEFVAQAGDFLAGVQDHAAEFSAVERDLRQRAAHYAAKYEPIPDARVGALLHAFLRSKRGPLSRTLGQISAISNAVVAPVGRIAGRAISGRIRLEGNAAGREEASIRVRHEQQITVQTRDFLRELIPLIKSLPRPAAALAAPALQRLDADAVTAAVVHDALLGDSVSDSFRLHAEKKLEEWWSDHKVRRHLLVELDALLMFTPTAVAVPLAFFSGGVGVPEVMALAGPLAGDFFSRIMEQQFADHWFDFLAPWRREQQDRLESAFQHHLLAPLVRDMEAARQVLEGATVEALNRSLEACRKHS